MTYKTYECNSFNVHTIKTDRFKTVHMEIIFRKKAVESELPSYTFLTDLLVNSTKKYPKRREFMTYLEELYKPSIYGTTSKTGNVLNTNFILDFISPEYIDEEKYLEKVLALPFEVLQEPNVTNCEFELKDFNLIKERLLKEVNALSENPVKLSIKDALSNLEGDTPTKYSLLGSTHEIELITPSSLYKIYRKLFKENTCDIFIIGNLDMNTVVTLIKKFFKNRYINTTKLDIDVFNETRKKELVVNKKSDNLQANLVMIYNTCNIDRCEKNVTMQVFNYLFGSGGLTCKLYKSIREENSLCYSIYSYYLKYDNILIIQVSLEQANVKKAISLIKKNLKSMENGDFSLDDLEDAKKNLIISLDLIDDNNVAILNNYVFQKFDNLPDKDERRKLYEKITKEDIINISKKLKLNTIFTLLGKGDN